MPYADPERQRTAVCEAVRRLRERRQDEKTRIVARQIQQEAAPKGEVPCSSCKWRQRAIAVAHGRKAEFCRPCARAIVVRMAHALGRTTAPSSSERCRLCLLRDISATATVPVYLKKKIPMLCAWHGVEVVTYMLRQLSRELPSASGAALVPQGEGITCHPVIP